jgi:mannose-1-phosphate guanylyltransferase
VEAIVLVGGQGTRLRPLTLTTPKPVLPAAGVPLLTHLLTRAVAAGVDHVVLATSYRAEVFAATFGDGSALGVDLECVTEDEPLGTGGAIRHVADRLRSAADDPVLILNGDVLSGHDIAAQVALHRSRCAGVTLHLTEVADATAFGCVPTDETGRVTAFHEKMPVPVTNRINAGCYVFSRSLIDEIPAGQVVSVERETFPGLLARGELVLGFVDTAYWLDLGTPEAYVAGSCDLVTGRAPSPAVPKTGSSLVLDGATVAPDAVLDGGTTVGAGADVGPAATVTSSVVLDGARIGAGATVRRSVVGRDAVVGDATVLDGVVLGDGARLGAGNELLTGARVWPGAIIGDGAVRFSSG